MVAVRPLSTPELVTWEDFLDLPDDDLRELIDGELVEVEVPGWDHEACVMNLGFHLVAWTRAHGGQVLASGYKVRISKHRAVMPDVQLYRAGRKPPARGLDEGAPDLVVEVISPTSGRYDRKTKLEYYRSIGVPEYWIVDLQLRLLDRHLLKGDDFIVGGTFDDTETFSPATFEGLSIPLAELFPDPATATGAEPDPSEDHSS